MTRNFQLTKDAQTDLIAIRRYTLSKWGAAQSEKYLSELQQAIQVIAKTPSIGKLRSDLGSDVFSFFYASHAIYYIVSGKKTIVFGVLHKHMLPSKHLSDRNT